MIEPEQDPYVEWIAREARRPAIIDPAAKARLLAAVRAEPLPRRQRARWGWFLNPRPLTLSPLGGLALAASLVGVGVMAGLLKTHGDGQVVPGRSSIVAPPLELPVHDTVLKFVLVAPHAKGVALVGDFNDWNAAATPMARTPTGGTWSVALQLKPGRHVYAFIVDGVNGVQWVTDPGAPLAPADGFGTPNSVVLVGGSSS